MRLICRATVLLASVLFLVGCMKSSSPTTESTPSEGSGEKDKNNTVKEQGIKITAEQLFKDFNQDPNTATTKYKDKRIEITGAVCATMRGQDGPMCVLV